MKHIFNGLAICIGLSFNILQLSAQVNEIDSEELNSDTVGKKVEVAFRTIDEKDLMGGISVIDVDEMTKKAYTLNSFALVENLVGGINGNIWGMNEMLVG